jgi:glycosyltransferase involved in cell wall biosynthesis
MFKIIIGVFRSDVIFCWFASVYASIGVVFGRVVGIQSIIVVGGVDVAKEKELNYGIWLSAWKSKLVRYALQHADRVLVVDPCLKEDAVRLAKYDGKNIVYLPTGYDVLFWKPMGEKEPIVLTVAVVHDEQRVRLKGIDTLIETARKLPEMQFIVIGTHPELVLKFQPPANMTFHPTMERKSLLPYYRQSKVYCQPSRREGLPNTLCEAMLCGCVPVATEVGGNGTAIGDTGILVPSNDPEALCNALMKAMKSTDDIGAKARSRIVALFPKEKRERDLLRVIKGIKS